MQTGSVLCTICQDVWALEYYHRWFKIDFSIWKIIWPSAWDFQQCGMCDQQSLRSACTDAQSDQSLCLSLEYSMTVKLLTEHHLEFLSWKGGCTGSSKSTHVKLLHCWKFHATAHFESNSPVEDNIMSCHWNVNCVFLQSFWGCMNLFSISDLIRIYIISHLEKRWCHNSLDPSFTRRAWFGWSVYQTYYVTSSAEKNCKLQPFLILEKIL